jgi:hypothetical protein
LIGVGRHVLQCDAKVDGLTILDVRLVQRRRTRHQGRRQLMNLTLDKEFDMFVSYVVFHTRRVDTNLEEIGYTLLDFESLGVVWCSRSVLAQNACGLTLCAARHI